MYVCMLLLTWFQGAQAIGEEGGGSGGGTMEIGKKPEVSCGRGFATARGIQLVVVVTR